MKTHQARKLAAGFGLGLLMSLGDSAWGLLRLAQDNVAVTPQTVEVASVEELKRLFQRLDYTWPPRGQVPAVAVRSLPRDFPAIRQVREKKALFLSLLTPIVVHENRRLREQRKLVKLLLSQPLNFTDDVYGEWLQRLARDYRIDPPADGAYHRIRDQLLAKLDEIPLKLVLAQAAIESGWGTSRFALEGNSLFGQWTYAKNAGLVPDQRDEGATHSVAAFPSLQASVRSYLNNLNRNRAYRELRQIRARLRQQGRPLDAHALAAGLVRYSQRGDAYVKEVRRIIRSRSLASLDQVTLRLAMVESIDG